MRKILFVLALFFSHLLYAEDEWSDDWGDESWEEEQQDGFILHGFAEAAYGEFSSDNEWVGSRDSLNEVLLRLETEYEWSALLFKLKADVWHDEVASHSTGAFREAFVSFSPRSDMDVRIGRQILTWGTGDLVFLNDLFPKDWQSFFSGREQEYLKAPSDALKWSWFNPAINVDLVWTPEFDSDNYLNGERFSYFSPLLDSVTGARHSGKLRVEPEQGEEWALRLYRNVASAELGLYAYKGFGKRPKAVDAATFRPRFYPLNAYGGSVRLPLAGGIANAEVALHQSKDDASGDDPLVPNDQWRFLLGFEREILAQWTPKLTLALQYYLEKTQDYKRQQQASFFPDYEQPEHRDVVTLRLRKQMLQDNLTLSLFVYHSPAEQDAYWMPSLSYRYSDRLSVALGGNFYQGKDDHTFFGQLQDNDNVYGRIRYSF